jgi:cytochrome c
MVSQSPRLSENLRPANSRPRRSGVMKGGQLWRRACVLVLFVAIPDIARSGPRGLHVLADQQIQLVANPQKGALLFQKRCSMCHTTQEGGLPNISGPLHGLFGRQAGTFPGYDYSVDLRTSRIVWDAQTLDEYLADPHRGGPGDKMPYPGLSSKTDRDDLITYLEQATQ